MSIRLSKVLLLAAPLALAGCADTPADTAAVPPASEILGASNAIAQALVTRLDPKTCIITQPLIVASLVDVSNMSASSPLGRMLGEQIGTALSNAGMPVAELKLRDAVLVQEGRGELALSRNVAEIARARNADAVVVGTYAAGQDSVVGNVRMVAPDGRVLSAANFALPMSRDVAALLNDPTGLVPTGPGIVRY